MVFQNDILAGASGAGGYTIDQSIRFDEGGPAYLSRTLGTPTDGKTFTFSAWIKRGKFGNRTFLSASGPSYPSPAEEASFYIASEVLDVYEWTGSAYAWHLRADPLLRDPSAWYHLVLIYDSTEATSSDRVRLYTNGEQITSFQTASYPSLNSTTFINSAEPHRVAYRVDNLTPWDGYMAEINFVDGQALEPTSFGETNNDGVWIPKAYAGTYGNNGFYITGADSADLGADESGNGNDFTSSGLTSDDQMLDTPTDNFATINRLSIDGGTTLSDGNLAISSANYGNNTATFFLTSGKWYWEAQGTGYVGAVCGNAGQNWGTSLSATGSNSIGYYTNGTLYYDGGNDSGGASYTSSDIISVAVDMDAGTIKFYKNNALQYDRTFGSNNIPDLSDGVFPCYNNGAVSTTKTVTFNFGQSGFTYTPPSGFKALSTAALSAPTIADGSAYSQTTLYTGNGTAIGSGGNAVSQSGNSTFQPDLVWIKRRDSTVEHALTDAVRGTTKELSSNDTGAEETVAEGLTTFGSSGFTVGSDGSYNTNTGTYAAWQWLAGNGTVSNADGTITSTVSANTTAGFSVVTATQSASAGTYSFGHGLGVKPAMLVLKNIDSAQNWQIWNKNLSSETDSYLQFNTNAEATFSPMWGTAPNSSTFSAHTSGPITAGDAFVAYCFAEIDGFSKFGKYTGNSSTNGPFVWCGFRPAFVMIKGASASGRWNMYDSTRDPNNDGDWQVLDAQSTVSESTLSGSDDLDFLSNGFKLRRSASNFNTSGVTYIFMAYAEHPFGGDGVAPVPAR
ncbi:MAG: hypothetical protein EBV86_05485 [Marivivens sp.]|nr:hypothetical protein [Marivivens sp.]